jgi:hypothetical protein
MHYQILLLIRPNYVDYADAYGGAGLVDIYKVAERFGYRILRIRALGRIEA